MNVITHSVTALLHLGLWYSLSQVVHCRHESCYHFYTRGCTCSWCRASDPRCQMLCFEYNMFCFPSDPPKLGCRFGLLKSFWCRFWSQTGWEPECKNLYGKLWQTHPDEALRFKCPAVSNVVLVQTENGLIRWGWVTLFFFFFRIKNNVLSDITEHRRMGEPFQHY